MNEVAVVFEQYKEILVTTTGWNGKVSSLVGIYFARDGKTGGVDMFGSWERHG